MFRESSSGDPEHDPVVVVRWIDGKAFPGFVERVLAAVTD